MGNEIYTGIKEKLKAKPKKLTDLDQWLFVVPESVSLASN